MKDDDLTRKDIISESVKDPFAVQVWKHGDEVCGSLYLNISSITTLLMMNINDLHTLRDCMIEALGDGGKEPMEPFNVPENLKGLHDLLSLNREAWDARELKNWNRKLYDEIIPVVGATLLSAAMNCKDNPNRMVMVLYTALMMMVEGGVQSMDQIKDGGIPFNVMREDLRERGL